MAITDRAQMGADPVAKVARLGAMLGPQLAVLVREPSLSPRALFEFGAALRDLLAPLGAALLISDRGDVARALGVGLQLKESSYGVPEARALLGSAALIGASRHDAAGVARAAAEGASYVTVSPIFAAPGKGAPLGLPGWTEIRQANPAARLIALGGIDVAHAAALFGAGADAIAAIRAAWAEDLALPRWIQAHNALARPEKV